jgi:HEAT repeat protein
MQQQLNEAPPLEGPRAARLPAQLVPVLRKALAKDPGERYATTRGMATALRLARGTKASPEPTGQLLGETRFDPVEANDEERRAEREERAGVLRAALLLTLVSGDVPERCGAALRLGRMGPFAKDAVPALVEALNDAHPHVAEAAASALKRIARTTAPAVAPPAAPSAPAGSPAVIDLIDMLRHEDASLRRMAVVALGEARSVGRDAVPELVEVLEDQDEAVRREAARALGRLGAAGAVPSLVVALSAPDELVRASAAEALGRIGPAATVAIPALIAALKQADDRVSDAAACALVRIGLSAAPALIEAVSDDDRRLRTRAAAILTEIVTAPGSVQSLVSLQSTPA